MLRTRPRRCSPRPHGVGDTRPEAGRRRRPDLSPTNSRTRAETSPDGALRIRPWVTSSTIRSSMAMTFSEIISPLANPVGPRSMATVSSFDSPGVPCCSHFDDVHPDLQVGMPQPSADTPRPLGPTKPGGKQLGGQRPRVCGGHLQAINSAQTAGIEFDCGATAENGVRDTIRLAQRSPSQQVQRADEVRSPGSMIADMTHLASLRAQQIACESPIFQRQGKFFGREELGRVTAANAPLVEVSSGRSSAHRAHLEPSKHPDPGNIS